MDSVPLIPLLMWIGYSLSCIRHDLKDYLAHLTKDSDNAE